MQLLFFKHGLKSTVSKEGEEKRACSPMTGVLCELDWALFCFKETHQPLFTKASDNLPLILGTCDIKHHLTFLSQRRFTANHKYHCAGKDEKVRHHRTYSAKPFAHGLQYSQISESELLYMFISLVRKYTRARKLTPRMLNE